MKIKLFAKEKPGLNEAISSLKHHTNNVEIYLGEVGESIPSEAFNNNCDLLISYLSPWIIPEEILGKTNYYAINFHPGPPEYPGIGCTNFAIYNEERTFGVTAHLMKKKVDSGEIIKVIRFPILENDSVFTLTQKCYKNILLLFKETISQFIQKKHLEFSDEVWTRKAFTRKQLNELCRIDLDMDEKEIKKRIKATTYPGMPGAYLDLYGFRFTYENLNNK